MLLDTLKALLYVHFKPHKATFSVQYRYIFRAKKMKNRVYKATFSVHIDT